VFDCSTVPDAPLSVTQLEVPRGYHDVAFDPDGNLVGSDRTSLLKVDSDDRVQVWVPNNKLVDGMDWLPDGDLVVADDSRQSLIRVSPDGATSALATDVDAFGVEVAPDGRVYAAGFRGVWRVDPGTGETAIVADLENESPRLVNFSPELDRMYIGTSGQFLYAVELDPDLVPIGRPRLFATVPGSHADGLGVDVCGNLYVPVFDTFVLYRVSPEGEVQVYYDFDGNISFGHGLEWGSGLGDWKDTALYLPQPFNGDRVLEIDIGVPSREWEGVVIGR
jgi:sugar lactone lactonase YvrE